MPTEKNRRPNPYIKAGFISKLFFCWLTRCFREGAKHELTLDDVYDVLPEDCSKKLGDGLSNGWYEQVRRCHEFNSRRRPSQMERRPSLSKVIWIKFRRDYLLVGLFAFFQECILKIVQPLFLGLLIQYFNGAFQGHELNHVYGHLLAAAIILANILTTFTHHPYFFGVQHIGSQVRIACSSMLYKKALRLSQASLRESSIGQLVNLLSNDVNRFDQTTVFLHFLWIGPLQFVIITGILWYYFREACFSGLGILLLFVPIQGYVGSRFSKLRSETALRTDERIQITSEILNGIKVIKMYAWEKLLTNLIETCRSKEINVIRKSSNLRAFNVGIFFVSSKIMVFTTLLTHVLMGNALSAELVFVSIALYNNLRPSMSLYLPSAIAQLAEARISVRRLEDFMLKEERKSLPINSNNPREIGIDLIGTGGLGDMSGGQGNPDVSIVMKHLFAKWNPKHEEYTLTDINLTINTKQMVCLIGHVGSGKGALLNVILQELPPILGSVVVNGSIAYASQEPWIFSGTIRENIVFGNNFNQEWYDQILVACALTKDLEVFPKQDETIVGDKGSNLSGGQKARISLARACYADADIYLLDDPLSAVDTVVGNHLFTNCINGFLKNKLRVLVTHQLQFLKAAERILLVKDGKIKLDGPYEALLADGLYFAEILEEYHRKGTSKVSSSATFVDSKSLDNLLKASKAVETARMYLKQDRRSSSTFVLARHHSITSGENTILGQVIQHEVIADMELVVKPVKRGLLESSGISIYRESSYEESQTLGSITCLTYWEYFKAGTTCFSFFVLLLSNLLTQAFYTASDFMLGIWTTFESKRKQDVSMKEQQIHLIVNSLLILFICFLSVIRVIVFFHVAMTASVNLHTAMFTSVIRSPMKFFELNPVGRILNRFSKDLGLMDEMMPLTAFDAIAILMLVLGVIVLIGIINPILLIPAAILLVILHFFRKYYLKTARSVKRLEGIARSPVFSHLTASLNGLATIRAYKKQEDFIKQFDEYQDLHSASWFLFISTSRSFGFVLDWMSIVYISAVIYNFFIFKSVNHKDDMSTDVGLAISSAMLLTGILQWGIRQSAEVENQFVSVERIVEYTKLIPEAPLESLQDRVPPPDWPKYGEIVMTNVTLSYGGQGATLRDISCHIAAGEKIGIVGRTGAGKSSLVNALFRIVEPSGKILVDQIDILSLGLHDLRSKISIIPQEPFLFQGTLRMNMDPFDQYMDPEIWQVLKDVSLYEEVKQLPDGLYLEITEGGNNLSMGQKQLICLGRAILMQNKILVLDEATANVDPETDAFIQHTIRQMFKNCTVLTVAHRLNTIMDSDRIMVFSSGVIVVKPDKNYLILRGPEGESDFLRVLIPKMLLLELDAPWTLLRNKHGTFYALVEETGKSSKENLIHIAKVAWEKRHPQL